MSCYSIVRTFYIQEYKQNRISDLHLREVKAFELLYLIGCLTGCFSLYSIFFFLSLSSTFIFFQHTTKNLTLRSFTKRIFLFIFSFANVCLGFFYFFFFYRYRLLFYILYSLVLSFFIFVVKECVIFCVLVKNKKIFILTKKRFDFFEFQQF